MGFVSTHRGTLADAALARNAAVFTTAVDRVRLGVFVALRAMSLSSVHSEARRWRAVVIHSLADGVQVARVHAWRIAAQVVDGCAFWNWPEGHLVGEPVRKHVAAGFVELPVTGRETPALPFPALAGAAPVNLRPETLRRRPDYELRARGAKNVTMALPAPVVHPAPTALFSEFVATLNGACHA